MQSRDFNDALKKIADRIADQTTEYAEKLIKLDAERAERVALDGKSGMAASLKKAATRTTAKIDEEITEKAGKKRELDQIMHVIDVYKDSMLNENNVIRANAIEILQTEAAKQYGSIQTAGGHSGKAATIAKDFVEIITVERKSEKAFRTALGEPKGKIDEQLVNLEGKMSIQDPSSPNRLARLKEVMEIVREYEDKKIHAVEFHQKVLDKRTEILGTGASTGSGTVKAVDALIEVIEAERTRLSGRAIVSAQWKVDASQLADFTKHLEKSRKAVADELPKLEGRDTGRKAEKKLALNTALDALTSATPNMLEAELGELYKTLKGCLKYLEATKIERKKEASALFKSGTGGGVHNTIKAAFEGVELRCKHVMPNEMDALKIAVCPDIAAKPATFLNSLYDTDRSVSPISLGRGSDSK